MDLNYYYQKFNVQITSRVAKQLKIKDLRK